MTILFGVRAWRAQTFISTSIAVLLTALAGSPAMAQENWVPYNAMVRTNQGDDIGHNKGYTTGALLLGVPFGQDVSGGMAYLDLRGHVENNGRLAYNVGGGYRWADFANQRIYGVRAGFDGRDYECQNSMVCSHVRYNWVNAGLETLGTNWDARANVYLNAGKREKLGMLESVGFEGNNLLVAPFYSEALWGFDAEIGLPFKLFRADVKDNYAAIGGYSFYSRNGKDATGVRVRYEFSPTDYMSFGVRGSIDNKFDTSLMARATLHFGSAPKASGRTDVASKNTLTRMIEFPERQELVVADDGLSKRKHILTGSNGQAVPFVHVDNTAPAGGSGTYESRYDQLTDLNGAGSHAGDIIILYRGDGTTHFYDQGVQLKDNQYLIGQGSFGMFHFAGTPVWFHLPGGRPTITNVNLPINPNDVNNLSPVGDAITLANNDTLVGFDIVGAGRNGIRGDNIDSAHISDVNFRDNHNDGVYITNASGSVTVENSTCSHNGFITPAHPRTAVDCIDVKSATTGNLDVVYRNNMAFDNYGNGLEASSYTTGLMTVLEQNNTVYGNTEGGMSLENGDGTHGTNLTATFLNNNIHDNNWQGILFGSNAGAASANLIFTNNIISHNGYMPDFQGAPFNGPNPQQPVGVLISVNSSPVVATFTGNTIINNAGSGIFLSAGVFNNNSSIRAQINGNTITGNGAVAAAVPSDFSNGITAIASSSNIAFTARTDILVSNNVLSGNTTYGFAAFTLGTSGNATLCARATGNTGGDPNLASQNGLFRFTGTANQPGSGTFLLEPSTGSFTNIGTITSVPLGTCLY